MTTYLSSLLTSTTSKYNNLRRSLLSDETDGDTENDSHISRVLRAYYTEKGRQFPPWLPPDSSRPQPMQSQYSYGQQAPQHAQAAAPAPRRGGALSDLWADTPQERPQQQRTASLRTGRSQLGAALRTDSSGSSASQRLAPGGARPLPSQREGSYQSTASMRADAGSGSNPNVTTPGGSAQDKLKARLWGGSKG